MTSVPDAFCWSRTTTDGTRDRGAHRGRSHRDRDARPRGTRRRRHRATVTRPRPRPGATTHTPARTADPTEVGPDTSADPPLDPAQATSAERGALPPSLPPPSTSPGPAEAAPAGTAGPSEDYLAQSLLPSLTLPPPADSPPASPATPRKLLILDLNGTLLLRSPHAAPSRARPHGQPRTRTAHPRPYMPALRSFLFHPHTKEWLDTMVWSSAQPHSVQDMVARCFRGGEGLVAVWARDTLGLSHGDYSAFFHHIP